MQIVFQLQNTNYFSLREQNTNTKYRMCISITYFNYLYFNYYTTLSADLSETRADPIGLCLRPGRRPGSPTKSGRARLVEFGHYTVGSGDGRVR